MALAPCNDTTLACNGVPVDPYVQLLFAMAKKLENLDKKFEEQDQRHKKITSRHEKQFLTKLDEWQQTRKNLIQEFKNLIKMIHRKKHKADGLSLFGSFVAMLGHALTSTGFAMSLTTAGLATPVLIVGALVGVTRTSFKLGSGVYERSEDDEKLKEVFDLLAKDYDHTVELLHYDWKRNLSDEHTAEFGEILTLENLKKNYPVDKDVWLAASRKQFPKKLAIEERVASGFFRTIAAALKHTATTGAKLSSAFSVPGIMVAGAFDMYEIIKKCEEVQKYNNTKENNSYLAKLVLEKTEALEKELADVMADETIEALTQKHLTASRSQQPTPAITWYH